MIGVEMGVHRLHQAQLKLVQELRVALNAVQHGIDDQRLAPGVARQQVGIGAGNRIEQLAKDHARPRTAPRPVGRRRDLPER